MHIVDVMTTNVITAREDTPVREIARLMLKYRISGLPIVDGDRHVVGIVSEGDLMRRAENDTDARYSWWLAPLISRNNRAADFIKAHGSKASDVMTRDIIAVTEGASLREVATILEKNHIKRVPVTRDGRLVGIVSRSNLLQGFSTTTPAEPAPGAPDDRTIRATVLHALADDVGVDTGVINVIVENGVVQLWGLVDTREEANAAQLAAEMAPGVKTVKNNLGQVPGWVWAD
jgi:CBS domain-containing protein